MVQYKPQEEIPIKLLPAVRNLIQPGLYFATVPRKCYIFF